MSDEDLHFKGDFSSLWRLDVMPPIRRLSWWWWWALILIPDAENPGRSKQLMVLWSTKETPAIRVSGHWWKPGGRMFVDEDGGHVIPGMVCAWWFDGEKMFEPLVKRECRMASISDTHPLWPGEGKGEGAGAVVPLTDEDMSIGMAPGNKSFWINLSSDEEAISEGAPAKFKAELTPWWGPPSELTYRNNVYFLGMGYDILRLQATKCKLLVDGEVMEGTGYFQKVSVQAPSFPWFWGMLHFDDGSYLDWFMPHVTPMWSARDDEPWRLRDFFRTPNIGTGVFHDRKTGKTQNFDNCTVELSKQNSPDALKDEKGKPLPEFLVRVWNEDSSAKIRVRAVSRARWVFDQPTRASWVSHLTYNEYPLEVISINYEDSEGSRNEGDYQWIHGNAEHAWGVLH